MRESTARLAVLLPVIPSAMLLATGDSLDDGG